MRLTTEPYLEQRQRWPAGGRHVLAQFDDDSVVVYQAYRPEIGQFAAKNGYFGGAFSLGRMSWVKPNFLWMMSRSGWGTKEGQEVTLAVRLRRTAFDAILKEAVHSTFVPEVHGSQAEWKRALAPLVRCRRACPRPAARALPGVPPHPSAATTAGRSRPAWPNPARGSVAGPFVV